VDHSIATILSSRGCLCHGGLILSAISPTAFCLELFLDYMKCPLFPILILFLWDPIKLSKLAFSIKRAIGWHWAVLLPNSCSCGNGGRKIMFWNNVDMPMECEKWRIHQMLSSFVLEGNIANWNYVMQSLDSALWLWNNHIRRPLHPWPFAMPLSCSRAVWLERFVLMTYTDIIPSRRLRHQLQCSFCHLQWIQVVKLLWQERRTRFKSTCGIFKRQIC
jgi:hypothetical protein